MDSVRLVMLFTPSRQHSGEHTEEWNRLSKFLAFSHQDVLAAQYGANTQSADNVWHNISGAGWPGFVKRGNAEQSRLISSASTSYSVDLGGNWTYARTIVTDSAGTVTAGVHKPAYYNLTEVHLNWSWEDKFENLRADTYAVNIQWLGNGVFNMKTYSIFDGFSLRLQEEPSDKGG